MKNFAFFSKIFTILKQIISDKKKRVLLVFVFIVVFTFCCIPILSNKSKTTKDVEQTESVSVSSYSENLENKLETMLSKVSEINSVSVMVLVESTPKIEYLTETEETISPNQNGSASTKSTTVVFEKNGSVSTPVVVTTLMPKVTGVLIVVNQVSASTKHSIINSVSVVLNIDAASISILQEG